MLKTSALETLNRGQFTYKDRFADTDTYNTLRHTGLHLMYFASTTIYYSDFTLKEANLLLSEGNIFVAAGFGLKWCPQEPLNSNANC